MPLTHIAITKAVAKDKPIKLSDGRGLHLLVRPGGSKLWRFRYRFAGRENMLGLGARAVAAEYPANLEANGSAKSTVSKNLASSGPRRARLAGDRLRKSCRRRSSPS